MSKITPRECLLEIISQRKASASDSSPADKEIYEQVMQLELPFKVTSAGKMLSNAAAYVQDAFQKDSKAANSGPFSESLSDMRKRAPPRHPLYGPAQGSTNLEALIRFFQALEGRAFASNDPRAYEDLLLYRALFLLGLKGAILNEVSAPKGGLCRVDSQTSAWLPQSVIKFRKALYGVTTKLIPQEDIPKELSQHLADLLQTVGMPTKLTLRDFELGMSEVLKRYNIASDAADTLPRR